MRCELCSKIIMPIARFEAGYTTCKKCSDATQSKKVGFMVFGHKTAPYLVTVDGGDKETLRIANRAHRRAR